VIRLSEKKPKLSDIVIIEIKEMIRRGDLRLGDKLPNQNEFAQQLGVSRPSLREALTQLTRLGVFEQKPGVGTILKAANPDLWAEHPVSPLLSDSAATIELTEARKSIETVVVQYAVNRITDAEIDALAEHIANMETAIEQHDYDTYLAKDVAFHFQIARAAHNRYVTHMFVTIRSLMEQFINEVFVEIPELLSNSFRHHVAIFEAIRARDQELAVQRIQEHIEDVRISLVTYYQNETHRVEKNDDTSEVPQ
jgi:GntR family transcriptional repressor for pyruvate dehydrogenase complex